MQTKRMVDQQYRTDNRTNTQNNKPTIEQMEKNEQTAKNGGIGKKKEQNNANKKN